MPRAGTFVTVSDTPPARGLPTDTGTAFVAGITERGSVTAPVLIRNMTDYANLLGARVTYGVLYDVLECAFREGLAAVYVGRVVGPTPTTATLTLSDGSLSTLTVKANSPGGWGTLLLVQVIASGPGNAERTLIISTVAAGELERSPSLATKADIVAWSQFSNYVTITDPGTGVLPAVAAATALGAATDDRANITDAQWLAALNLFNKELGPGQVAAPGQTTSARLLQLTAHAAAYNRVAVLDEADTNNVSTMTAAVVSGRDGNARFGSMYGPWLQIPGLTSGTYRDVPPSALMLGLIARSDASNGNPNVAAAGENGIARYVIRAKYDFDNGQRDTLNDGGVNVIRNMLGGVRAYGYRTLVAPTTYPHLLQFTGQRTVMAIAALGDDIMESFVFDQIDGQGRKFAEVNGALVGVCLPFYNKGALYGETPDEAFVVDTGAAVNTPTTIAQGEIRAVVSLRTSPYGEVVRLTLVKRSITEVVA